MFTIKPKTYRIAKKKYANVMPMNKKFADYIEEKGLRRVFVAKKVGMSQAYLSLICAQKYHIPKKYWRAIEEFTEHYITVQELLTDALERHENGIRKQMDQEKSVSD